MPILATRRREQLVETAVLGPVVLVQLLLLLLVVLDLTSIVKLHMDLQREVFAVCEGVYFANSSFGIVGLEEKVQHISVTGGGTVSR